MQIATPYRRNGRVFIGSGLFAAALATLGAAWCLPYLYESQTLFYKFGVDKFLLRWGKLAGLTTAVLMFWQIVLASRFKILDRVFSHNGLIAAHRINGIVILALALVHGIMILAADDFSFFPLELRYWPEFLGIVTAVVLTGFVTAAFWRRAIGLAYHVWWAAHRIVGPLAAAAVCVHILFVSETFESGLPRTLVVGAGIATLLLIGRLWLRRVLFSGNRFTVAEIAPEGASATRLNLTPSGGPAFAFLPGQFAFITPVNAQTPREEHPFTIASSPTGLDQIGFLIGAKGDWTKQVHQLKVGDAVRVDGPYGRFSHLLLKTASPIAMIAGGIGITPMLSMLRHMASQQDPRPVKLIWSLRSRDDMVATETMGRLKDRLANLQVAIVYTRVGEGGKPGKRLDSASLGKLMAGWPLDAAVFICGPLPMMTAMRRMLISLGYDARNIYSERFRF